MSLGIVLGVGSIQAQDASPQLVNVLQQYANATFSEGSTPALATQVTVGNETIRAAVGLRDGVSPALPNDRFRIGSMSKTFVAATAMRMAEDGLLNLDDHAADYLPDDVVNQIANLAGDDGATVRQLLSMQSGIPDYLYTPSFQEQARRNPQFAWTAADSVTYAYGLPALFAPGDNVSYSNTNYLLAQLVMEQADGAPLHELIRRYILAPLQLNDTYTQSFETLADTPDSTFVVGYQDFNGDGVPEDVSAINDGFGLGDGGLISTTQDVTTFYRALLIDQTLLTADSLAQMMAFNEGDDDVYGVGLDEWQTDFGPAIGHSGGVLGFFSIGVVLPDADVMIVVLCATTECVPEAIAGMIAGSLDSIINVESSGDFMLINTLQAQMDEEIAANPNIPGQLLTVIAPTADLDADLAAGVVDVESGDRLQPGAAFRISSVTKTFTAAAVLRLVEMGQVDLDASIEQYLSPESITILQADGYATDAIMVRQLLLHTSGIADFAGRNPAYTLALFDNPWRVWTRAEQIQFAVDTADPVVEPGAQYSYSDTGYSLLGELIEQQTGQNLGAAVRTLLDYERLGMANTYWEQFEPAPAETIMAHQYVGEVDITALLHPTADLYGAGGLVSTTRDLTLFYRALLRGEIFGNPATLETMLTIPETNIGADGGTSDAAMGIYRLSGDGLTCWLHTGSWGVIVLYCPDLDVAIARSINQANQQSVSLFSVINPAVIYVLENAN
jgi:D-alanyl-D-alanine carboxypeptidase